MKCIMMQVIDEVINQRRMNFSEDKEIQLSSTLMRKFIEELRDYISSGYVTNDIFGNQFSELEYKGTRVYNREYRDNTNDADVEETLYNLVCI